jgi:UDP-glucose 4-epimerase
MRFFNVYGPNQDPHSPYSGVISIFMQRAAESKDLTIFGDGEQSRDFVYVLDVVKTLDAAMQALQSGKETCNVFNVGTGNAITIRELAELVRRISGNAFPIYNGPPRSGEIRYSYCNNAHAAKQLGYIPSCPLEHGLQLTYDSVVGT